MPKWPFHKTRLVPDDSDRDTEPMRRPCFTCGGTGKCNTCSGSGNQLQFITCGRCGGTGEIQPQWNNPNLHATCPECTGTGTVPMNFQCDTCKSSGLCQVCGGSGYN